MQDLVHLLLQRRGRVAEGARLAGHLLGVGVLANRVDLVVARAGDRERAPESARWPGRLRTPSASPVSTDSSSVRPRASVTSPSATSWSPGSTRIHVARHDLVGAQLDEPAVADHAFALGATRSARLLEDLLRLQLLADADVAVDDRDEAEERVGEQAQREDDDEEAADDRVEEGEDVARDDRSRPSGSSDPRAVRACAAASPPPCSESPPGCRSSLTRALIPKRRWCEPAAPACCEPRARRRWRASASRAPRPRCSWRRRRASRACS